MTLRRSGEPDYPSRCADTECRRVEGIVSIPPDAKGIVLFVHGSGSSRFSPRNQEVALQLQDAGLITLLFDLLTEEEERIDRETQHLRFDIRLLARRTAGVLEWLDLEPYAHDLKIGLFGSSSGAAAALIAAAELPDRVSAFVSRGGRPDLAEEILPDVQAPTLLIVGEWDEEVLKLNEQALSQAQERDREEASHCAGCDPFVRRAGGVGKSRRAGEGLV
ncbi:MAG: dienelactone hydrolase family protein [Anaerolineales bacterium]